LKCSKDMYQSKNKMIITTPNQALLLFKTHTFKSMVNEAIVIDKVDMHIALELGSDLIELGKYLATGKVKPLFKTIITTNVSSESEGSSYVDIKKAFFGENKALVIQINEDLNNKVVSKSKLNELTNGAIVESIEHFYILCQTNLDKFLILFSFIKLGILTGKVSTHIINERVDSDIHCRHHPSIQD
jgi:hypothetical protein